MQRMLLHNARLVAEHAAVNLATEGSENIVYPPGLRLPLTMPTG